MKIGIIAITNSLRTLLCMAVLLSLIGCSAGEEIDSLRSMKDSRTIWVFAQFNVDNEDGVESYYYYGRVSETLYNRIKDNTISKGFVLLDDVRYYSSTDDKIHPYKDDEQKGELIFRIEDIKRIQLLARPPRMEKPDQPQDLVVPTPTIEDASKQKEPQAQQKPTPEKKE
jgi:hypothetical protein